MDYMCHSLSFVAVGIGQWLHAGWNIHVLLVIAIFVVLIQVIQGRRRV